MTDSTVLDIGQRALTLTFMICAPLLGFALIVGLIISVFQAATQIHEMTISFIPKMIAIAVAIVVFGPWMMDQLLHFTGDLFRSIPTLVK